MILQAQPQVERWLRNRYASDPIRLLTFNEGVRYRDVNKSLLLEAALRMQCGAIMSQGYGSVTGHPADPYLPNFQNFEVYGKSAYEAYNRGIDRPLPQAIGHQFDVALLKCINEWQKVLLKNLKAKMFAEAGSKSWYEVFLTCFVLLSNLEYIHYGAETYIQSKTNTVSSISYIHQASDSQ
jgi:hypothetical protein